MVAREAFGKPTSRRLCGEGEMIVSFFRPPFIAHEGRKEGGRGRDEAVGGAWMTYKRATAFRYG